MPPVPDKKAGAEIDNVDAAEGALLPSLSRRAAAHVGSAPIADVDETAASRRRARKLFSLDDEEGEGDLSDTEDRERDASGGEKGGVQKEAAPGAQMAAGREWLGEGRVGRREREGRARMGGDMDRRASECGCGRERRTGALDAFTRCADYGRTSLRLREYRAEFLR